jgi:hypothetical protein
MGDVLVFNIPDSLRRTVRNIIKLYGFRQEVYLAFDLDDPSVEGENPSSTGVPTRSLALGSSII